MIEVWDMPREVEAFVSMGLLGDTRGFGECQAVGYADERGLVAGVLFHGWDQAAGVIEVTAYADRAGWLTRARVQEIGHYIFDAAGCRIAVARVDERNAPVRRMWRRFGASEHVVPEIRGDGVAECVFVLRRDDWKTSRIGRSEP